MGMYACGYYVYIYTSTNIKCLTYGLNQVNGEVPPLRSTHMHTHARECLDCEVARMRRRKAGSLQVYIPAQRMGCYASSAIHRCRALSDRRGCSAVTSALPSLPASLFNLYVCSPPVSGVIVHVGWI